MLIIGLGIGGVAGYYVAPPAGPGGQVTVTVTGPGTTVTVPGPTVTVTKNPLENAVLKVGDIVAQTNPDASFEKLLIDNIMAPDLNAYLSALGFGATASILLDDAQGTPSIHLEKVQSFKSQGVNIIHGGRWSSQASGSLSYMNENNMILLSSSSTSPLLRIPNDALFRTCPQDLIQGAANAEMWKSWGVKAVLVFYRIDPWGEGLYQVMSTELPARGIELIERVAYAPETTDFASYLAHMDDLAAAAITKYGDKKFVGVQIFSFDEQITFLTQAESYPNIKDLIWISTESGGRSQTYIDQVGAPLVPKRMFSSLMGAAESSDRWKSLDSRYTLATKQTASFYTGADYDGMWILYLSMLEAGSTDAADIKRIIRSVAYNFYGTTGWVSLDENGDRLAQVFDIWGYYSTPGNTSDVHFRKWGEYDGRIISVSWNDAALAENGMTRPAIG
jgi:branched-chain amino acid transport system substrate-binding protein